MINIIKSFFLKKQPKSELNNEIDISELNNEKGISKFDKDNSSLISSPNLGSDAFVLNDNLWLSDLSFYDENIDELKNLLEKENIDINNKDKNVGDSILHFAIIKEYLNIINLLLQYENININIKNYNNETPLHYACIVNNLNIVKVLLEGGANPNNINLQNQNSLQYSVYYAKDNYNIQIIKELLNYHVNINHKDINLWNSLHLICNNINISSEKQIEIVKTLIDNGVNFHTKTNENATCKDLAKDNENDDLITFLDHYDDLFKAQRIIEKVKLKLMAKENRKNKKNKKNKKNRLIFSKKKENFQI
tara:strand:+ start:1148 stop:2068 length:921 start_codon:yes stop_codon:yes gene_type:complete